MKKIIFLMLLGFLCIGANVNAQKYAFIDSEYIYSQIPSYKKAQQQINTYAEKYKAELEKKQGEIKLMYENYQKEAPNLNAQQKVQRENAIVKAEKDLTKQAETYFGAGGLMEKMQKDMIDPIHDHLYDAVKQIANREGYAMILDRATTEGIIFVTPQIDISGNVLSVMGY